MSIKTYLAAFVLATTPLAVQAADCEAQYQQHLKTDLALSFKAFDQDEDGGWRALDNAKCSREAALLIQAYLDAKPDSPDIVRWHLAQMHGYAGSYPQARAAALMTLRPEPGPFPPGFRWNDYVLATIAFWDRDLPSFKQHASRVADSGPVDAVTQSMNAANGKVLDKLLQCFGERYADAMACPAQQR